MLRASLVWQYEPARDVSRLDGHARNSEPCPLPVALSIRLMALQPRLGLGVIRLRPGAGDVHYEVYEGDLEARLLD